MKIEVFEKWLSECPVNWVQTDNGLNLTETYDPTVCNRDNFGPCLPDPTEADEYKKLAISN